MLQSRSSSMAIRVSSIGIVAVTLAVAFGTSASADEPRWTWRDRPPIIVDHPVLSASLARLYIGSSRWRKALDDVVNTGRRVVVVTPDKIRIRDDSGADAPFDPDVIAEAQPLADDWSRVARWWWSSTCRCSKNSIATRPLSTSMPTWIGFLRTRSTGTRSRICWRAICLESAPIRCLVNGPRMHAPSSARTRFEATLRLGERRSYGLDGLTVARRFRQ